MAQVFSRITFDITPRRPCSTQTISATIGCVIYRTHRRLSYHQESPGFRGIVLPRGRCNCHSPNLNAFSCRSGSTRPPSVCIVCSTLGFDARHPERSCLGRCHRKFHDLACCLLYVNWCPITRSYWCLPDSSRLSRQKPRFDLLPNPLVDGQVCGNGTTCGAGGHYQHRIQRMFHQLLGHSYLPSRRSALLLLHVRVYLLTFGRTNLRPLQPRNWSLRPCWHARRSRRTFRRACDR